MTMKEFMNILTSEDRSFDGLKWWVYAIACPMGLIAVMAVAGWLETL